MADQLTEFLQHRASRTAVSSPDWEGRKADWLRSINHLFTYIKQLLHTAIESKAVVVQESLEEITEEEVGTYQIPVLTLWVGNEKVVFQPKGVNVIGASGRVDLQGASGALTIIRDEPAVDSDWSIIFYRVPRLVTEKLHQHSLRTALERVMLPLS